MKAFVSFSGGKDSQACLIWAVKTWGQKVEAVFCDTGHEHPLTYIHVQEVCDQLGVALHTLKSKKYAGFGDMSIQKGRFPSTKARFCTEELKIKPMVDFVLSQETDLLVIQGIRKDESNSRSKMEEQCHYFKGWIEPYGKDKKGRPRFNTYRKKDVLIHMERYSSTIMRPIFDWTSQDVINYILENNQKPNPLYYKGFSRVGCFPCIMCRQSELKLIIEKYPEHIDKIKEWESGMEKKDRHFFPPNYIPKRAMTNRIWPTTDDVVKYIKGKNETIEVFEEPEGDGRCMSYYHLCE
ncbi:phosphoadenosine phosphosulfate reductase family protein [Spirosoma sordidisoli]|uniref:Sulfate adenylate transferase n=1 Tax=Spirosoma sordidisoli TaxID=2502893 RepID=A0A4Q2USK4_9BACT|nr:phosphoadenosine phosphosulfate reductase family protein [Spirosoma sordidisoli]RYC70745.1 sulfate adenylate transferase [Spirosoma sordidisoli]